MNIPINLVFEDELSEFAMFKLLNSFGNKFHIGVSYPGYGFGYIKQNIQGFNQAAIAMPFFILTDLDKYQCPISLIRDWVQAPLQPNLIFRIVVREIEAWLLSDIEGFSRYSGVSSINFLTDPEKDMDPKRTLIGIAKKSRKRSLREDIIPINANAKIGPNYNDRLMEYISDFWDINRAMERSESLRRAYTCLNNFQLKIN